MTDFKGHIQKDPLFREQANVYSTIGGELPIRIFSSISNGMNMNELAEKLIDFDDRWDEDANFQTFELQARDILEEFEEEKLVQSGNDGWNLTHYGEQWREQMDVANKTLLSLLNDNEIAASRFEAEDSQLIYRGDETLGDMYNALGFNVRIDEYPEALPALHILAEDVNNGTVPGDYSEGVEQLELMGMVETEADGSLETDINNVDPSNMDSAFYDRDSGPSDPEITEIGRRIYDEVVLSDREFVAEHYGLG